MTSAKATDIDMVESPSLLTLQGLYSTSKEYYTTFVPASAAGVLQNVAATVMSISAPLVAKLLNCSAKSGKAAIDVPLDLVSLDGMLAKVFASGDAKIDALLAASLDYCASTKDAAYLKVDEAKATVHGKVGEAKTFALGKYSEVRPLVSTKVEEAKAVVAKKIEGSPEVAKVVDAAAPYYAIAKDNVEPAKVVLSGMVGTARGHIAAQGVVGYAKTSAEELKVASLATVDTLRAKGPVAGAKEVTSHVLASVVAALEEAKVKEQPTPPSVAEVFEKVEDEGFSSADDKDEENKEAEDTEEQAS